MEKNNICDLINILGETLHLGIQISYTETR